MTTEKKPERMKLTILEVKPRLVTNAERGTTKLTFKAQHTDGEHWFYTFRSSLFEIIEGGQGKTFEADVLTTESEQWGTQRDVKQLYVNGEPVAGKKQWQGGRQDSPETRLSIESQKRADIISHLWLGEKLLDDDPLVSKLKGWLHKLEEITTNRGTVTHKAEVPKQIKEEEELWPEEGTVPSTTEELYNWLASSKGWRTTEPAHSFLVHKCRISEERIKFDPTSVYHEVKQLL